MGSPDFSFIFQTVFTDELKLMIDSLLFEWSSRSVVGGGIYDKED
jgi:hypothetical protein